MICYAIGQKPIKFEIYLLNWIELRFSSSRCTRCLLFIERHRNLLQYRESKSFRILEKEMNAQGKHRYSLFFSLQVNALMLMNWTMFNRAQIWSHRTPFSTLFIEVGWLKKKKKKKEQSVEESFSLPCVFFFLEHNEVDWNSRNSSITNDESRCPIDVWFRLDKSQFELCPIEAPYRLTHLIRDGTTCHQTISSSIGECANPEEFRLSLASCSTNQVHLGQLSREKILKFILTLKQE